MNIDNQFKLAQRVYMITDPDQRKGIVFSITIDLNGITYGVAIGGELFDCYAAELSPKKNTILGAEKDEEKEDR